MTRRINTCKLPKLKVPFDKNFTQAFYIKREVKIQIFQFRGPNYDVTGLDFRID